MAYLKPQSPIKYGEDHIYPLTTVDQIMMGDGNRLSGVGVYLEKPEEFEATTLETGINAATLDGKLASEYALKTDTATNSNQFNGYTFDAFRTLMLDTIYPVGSIYMSVSDTSPASLFGGTWERISQGRMLLGMGAIEENHNSYWGTVTPGEVNPVYAGEMGGEAWHTLTENEMPSHIHTVNISSTETLNRVIWGSGYGSTDKNAWGFHYVSDAASGLPSDTSGVTAAYKGGGAAHNNIPPYFAVYMWKRTA